MFPPAHIIADSRKRVFGAHTRTAPVSLYLEMKHSTPTPLLCPSLRRASARQRKMTTLRSGDSATTTLHTLRVEPITPFNRLHALLYSAAVLALFYHRSATLLRSTHLLPTSLLLLADLVLFFMWVTTQAFRWRPVRRREFPERYSGNLPALDVFICTADPYKEPPVGVVATALSVMAFDYPADRLSVYVSDDGGSEMTLFAFMEAARFAQHWLPFCRERGIRRRSPEAYFGSEEEGGTRSGSDEIKMMYQTMKQKVEAVMEAGYVGEDLIPNIEDRELFKKWKGYTRRDHPSIIQVLLESIKDTDIMGNTISNLVYVSREKCGTAPHHFKAGALNTLLRVSSSMTDAPVVLTLDCDMHSNDPQAPLRALCYLLDPAIAYVQFPQKYQGLNKNDIYAGEIKRLFTINARGLDGLRGPDYVGTCCFHSRRSFFGPPSSPLPTPELRTVSLRSDAILKRGHEVARCSYELGTKWGSTVGFRYGSLVEDYHTGYRLQCEGWVSTFCDPERPAFLGDAPRSLIDSLSQCKRWTIGLYEVAFSRFSPITFGTRRGSLLMGLGYAHYSFWGSWCIPVPIYAIVPQLALVYGLPLFPKLSDPWFYLYVYLFLAAYGQDLLDFLIAKGTIQRWWSDQRMWLIRGLTSYPFGTAQYALNKLGISAPGFNVTNKVMVEEQDKRYEKGVFDFGLVSPFFVALGTVAILNLTSFITGIIRAVRKEGSFDEMFVQLFLSGFGVVNCWPVHEAMFLRGDGGRMPKLVTNISTLLALMLHFIGYFMFTA